MLARLEALTARLNEQGERIAALEAENAGLKAALQAPAGAVRAASVSGTVDIPTTPSSEIAGVYGVSVGAAPGVRGESTLGIGVFGVAIGTSAASSNPASTTPPIAKAGLVGFSDSGI